MRFKTKKPIKRIPTTYPVDSTDILATWHIKKEWGQENVVMTTAHINKFCFLANGRVLSKPMPDGFIIMGAFLDEKSRDAAVANVRTLGKNAATIECPTPETRDAGFGPLRWPLLHSP